MTFKSSVLFAYRLIFPRTEKKSTAKRSIAGAIICIGISLIPLVVVMSFAEGMIGGMTQRIIGLSTGELKAYVRTTNEYGKSYDGLKNLGNEFLKVQGISDFFPQIESDVLVSGKKKRTGARVRAVETDIFQRNQDFKSLFRLISGSLEDFKPDGKSAVIGEKISEILNVKPGDTLRIIMTKTNQNGGISPVVSTFRIVAIVSSGYQELDAMWIFIPIQKGFSILPKDSSSVSLMLKATDGVNAELGMIKAQCDEKIFGRGRIFSWDELNRSQFQNFSSTKVMLTFIMLLIVLVASVNISSALIMLVMERRKEIAILKSVGGTNSGIAVSFLLAGITCGLSGTLLGLPIGVLCALNTNHIVSILEKLVNFFSKLIFILGGNSLENFEAVHMLNPAYYLTEIPVSIPFEELFLIASSVILLSLVVSVVPAVKAGKERPLETFRKA